MGILSDIRREENSTLDPESLVSKLYVDTGYDQDMDIDAFKDMVGFQEDEEEFLRTNPQPGLVSEFGRGLLRGGIDLANIPFEVANFVARNTGWEGAEELSDDAIDYLEGLQQDPSLRESYTAATGDFKNLRWWLSNTGQALPSIGATFAGGALGTATKLGKFAGAAMAGGAQLASEQAGDIRRFEERTGIDVPTSSEVFTTGTYALVGGALEAVLPAMVLSKHIVKETGEIIGKKTGAKLAKEIWSKWKDVPVGMGTEGTTEALQTITQNALAEAGYDSDREILEGVVDAFLIGGAVGGVVGTVETLTKDTEDGVKDGLNKELNPEELTGDDLIYEQAIALYDSEVERVGPQAAYKASIDFIQDNNQLSPEAKKKALQALQEREPEKDKLTQQLEKSTLLQNLGLETTPEEDRIAEDLATDPTQLAADAEVKQERLDAIEGQIDDVVLDGVGQDILNQAFGDAINLQDNEDIKLRKRQFDNLQIAEILRQPHGTLFLPDPNGEDLQYVVDENNNIETITPEMREKLNLREKIDKGGYFELVPEKQLSRRVKVAQNDAKEREKARVIERLRVGKQIAQSRRDIAILEGAPEESKSKEQEFNPIASDPINYDIFGNIVSKTEKADGEDFGFNRIDIQEMNQEKSREVQKVLNELTSSIGIPAQTEGNLVAGEMVKEAGVAYVIEELADRIEEGDAGEVISGGEFGGITGNLSEVASGDLSDTQIDNLIAQATPEEKARAMEKATRDMREFSEELELGIDKFSTTELIGDPIKIFSILNSPVFVVTTKNKIKQNKAAKKAIDSIKKEGLADGILTTSPFFSRLSLRGKMRVAEYINNRKNTLEKLINNPDLQQEGMETRSIAEILENEANIETGATERLREEQREITEEGRIEERADREFFEFDRAQFSPGQNPRLGVFTPNLQERGKTLTQEDQTSLIDLLTPAEEQSIAQLPLAGAKKIVDKAIKRIEGELNVRTTIVEQLDSIEKAKNIVDTEATSAKGIIDSLLGKKLTDNELGSRIRQLLELGNTDIIDEINKRPTIKNISGVTYGQGATSPLPIKIVTEVDNAGNKTPSLQIDKEFAYATLGLTEETKAAKPKPKPKTKVRKAKDKKKPSKKKAKKKETKIVPKNQKKKLPLVKKDNKKTITTPLKETIKGFPLKVDFLPELDFITVRQGGRVDIFETTTGLLIASGKNKSFAIENLEKLSKEADIKGATEQAYKELQSGKPFVPFGQRKNNPFGKAKENRKKKTNSIGAIAGVRNGRPWVKSGLSSKEFWNHFEGKLATPASKQKGQVLKALAKDGITLADLKKTLNNIGKIKTFLRAHEQSHIDNKDVDVYFKEGKDLLTKDKIAIEVRAIKDGLKKASPPPTVTLGFLGLEQLYEGVSPLIKRAAIEVYEVGMSLPKYLKQLKSVLGDLYKGMVNTFKKTYKALNANLDKFTTGAQAGELVAKEGDTEAEQEFIETTNKQKASRQQRLDEVVEEEKAKSPTDQKLDIDLIKGLRDLAEKNMQYRRANIHLKGIGQSEQLRKQVESDEVKRGPIRDFIRKWASDWTVPMTGILDRLDGFKQGKGLFTKMFYTPIDQATGKAIEADMNRKERIYGAIKNRITGRKSGGLMQRLKISFQDLIGYTATGDTLQQDMYVWLGAKNPHTRKVLEKMGYTFEQVPDGKGSKSWEAYFNKDGKKTYYGEVNKKGKKIDGHLSSKEQALATALQADLESKFRVLADVLQKVERVLALSEGDELSDKDREALRKVLGKDYKYFTQVKNYLPMWTAGSTISIDPANMARELLGEVNDEVQPGDEVNKNFSEERGTIGNKKIQLDLFNIWDKAVTMQEHYIHLAEPARLAQDTFNNLNKGGLMDDKYGESTSEAFNEYFKRVRDPNFFKHNDDLTRASRVLRRNTALAYLGYNLVTTAKQIPSLLYYLPYTGPTYLFRSVIRSLTGGLNETIRFAELDPQMKNRTMDRALEELRQSTFEEVWGDKLLGKFGKKGSKLRRGVINKSMDFIRAADKVATSIGYKAVYEYEIANGATDEEARNRARLATVNTQPAGSPKDIARLYATNEFLNMVLLFSNQVNKIWRMFSHDVVGKVGSKGLSGIDRNTLMHGMALGMGSVGIWSIANGFKVPEDPEEVNEALLHGMFNSIPLFGKWIMQAWAGYPISETPVTTLVENTTVALKNIKNGNASGKDFERFGEVAGLLTGVPYSQPRRLFKAITEDDMRLIVGNRPIPKIEKDLKALRNDMIKWEQKNTPKGEVKELNKMAVQVVALYRQGDKQLANKTLNRLYATARANNIPALKVNQLIASQLSKSKKQLSNVLNAAEMNLYLKGKTQKEKEYIIDLFKYTQLNNKYYGS